MQSGVHPIRQARKLPDELYGSQTWDRSKELADHKAAAFGVFVAPADPVTTGSCDWAHRDSARMRVLVKRILRKHGYPPDLEDGAVQTILQQAEALSPAWSI
jgi:Domain of unknown function (DUF3387)